MARLDKAEKISITLPPDMLQNIKEKVAAGTYGSTSEVIREAMRLWQRQEEEHEERLSLVRARLKQSTKSGKLLSTDQALERLQQHHKARTAHAKL